jgi:uncharacterized protein YndB with AHSA1/START domain
MKVPPKTPSKTLSEQEIILVRQVETSASKLWKALIAPQHWWRKEVILEPRHMGRFSEPWRDAQGESHDTQGRVLQIIPLQLLDLSWKDDDWSFETNVRFALQETAMGCSITLTHGGWQAAPEEARAMLMRAHRDGWEFHLANLVQFAENGPSGHKPNVTDG